LKGQQHHRPQQVEGHGHPEQGFSGLVQALEGGGLGIHAAIVGDAQTPPPGWKRENWHKNCDALSHVSFEPAWPWGYKKVA
jgi:hypothetical protein